MNSTATEKLGMLILAGAATTGLIWLGLAAMHERVDASAATLIGVIAGGLAASIKDIIAAIRGYSMSAQLSKVTDQLAASGPVPVTPEPTEPQAVVVTNTNEQAVPTTEART